MMRFKARPILLKEVPPSENGKIGPVGIYRSPPQRGEGELAELSTIRPPSTHYSYGEEWNRSIDERRSRSEISKNLRQGDDKSNFTCCL